MINQNNNLSVLCYEARKEERLIPQAREASLPRYV